MAALFSTSAVARSCFDLFPRYTATEARDQAHTPGANTAAGRQAVFAGLARRRRAPGLLAYVGADPVGFVSLGPRTDMRRLAASATTPPVDAVPVWVVPCLYVHPKHRRRGVAVALLRAAADYAFGRGAPAIEGYPRADEKAVHADFAFYGTVAMFRRAGFRKVRGTLPDLRKGWTPRWTMRATPAGGGTAGGASGNSVPARNVAGGTGRRRAAAGEAASANTR